MKKGKKQTKTNKKNKAGLIVGGIVVLGIIGAGASGDKTEDVKPAETTKRQISTLPPTQNKSIIDIVQDRTEAPETDAPEVVETEVPKETVEFKLTYWLNTDTGKYHYSDCSTIKDKTESHWQTTEDIDWLKANYSKCGHCKPH